MFSIRKVSDMRAKIDRHKVAMKYIVWILDPSKCDEIKMEKLSEVFDVQGTRGNITVDSPKP